MLNLHCGWVDFTAVPASYCLLPKRVFYDSRLALVRTGQEKKQTKKLTYLSILSFLSLGLFLCKLLLSLLSFGCLLPPDFVILVAGKTSLLPDVHSK